MEHNKNKAKQATGSHLQHYKHLDGLRGVASLVVVLYHMDVFMGVLLSPNGLYSQYSVWWQIYRRILDGNFSVCLFFVMSGYVLLIGFYKRQNDLSYLKESFIKRYFRLTPLVLASVILAVILQNTIGFHNVEMAAIVGGHEWLKSNYQSELTLTGAIYNGLYSAYIGDTSYNGPLWTIKIELMGSLFLYLYAALFFVKKNGAHIIISAILIYLIEPTLGCYLILFIIGGTILVYNIKLANNYILPASILTVVLATENPWTIEINFLNELTGFSKEGLATFCHSIAAILLLLIVNTSSNLSSYLSRPVFTFLGKISFSLYVFHIPIIMSIGTALFVNLHDAGINNQFASIISTLVSLLCCVFISWCGYTFVDKPSTKIASLVGDKLNMRASAL
ncbi:acyltransferase [Klebsiella aerogenes]|uniref:acyltransferase family protein n=1 Tax=Klebsiella aerogenes TaxID=548 RepID=UPI0023B98DD5|nr:acyltransferase [Klebsiella aerogenes]MCL9940485.1 acyltransferase [Klebsiella aerogenes]WPR86713.1 acyltransferase [Klebsiella aerogenes]